MTMASGDHAYNTDYLSGYQAHMRIWIFFPHTCSISSSGLNINSNATRVKRRAWLCCCSKHVQPLLMPGRRVFPSLEETYHQGTLLLLFTAHTHRVIREDHFSARKTHTL